MRRGLTAARRRVYGRQPEQGASFDCLDASRPGGVDLALGSSTVMGDPEFMRIIDPIPYSASRTVGTP